ncbi:MAG: tRNA uridine-5-carboxymethylaminomethyl(34) synthesis GTPase MnmE [Anaeromusa sp.]|uniref:tRNA uridine-5-carboxymethylaminomethyl(34) synthesis GTPase MnmE n=1 Tax=Anaeromusa sp. TaxID=1872520 RepID=UPI002B20559F|nr:tRNA uridine-5-carboxymethylaminomethyl(34) synthesis GTPase MnmE [Anaeromusa sp.]MEA4835900.1 tRNA uridine-5-carboxymethylaminomethyl(34) synthesis GTPase MnmE [Anaeromusa sp.]
MAEDTISAIVTAPGEAGVGIVRVSGPLAQNVGEALFCSASGRKLAELPSHYASYGKVVNPVDGAMVDEVLLLVMRAPHSYTREDVVEIQCHGSHVSLRRILALTLSCGARLAEPGEFTKRAFLNGRLDLTQAEAVMDVIRAKTEASLRLAVRHLEGGLAAAIRAERERLLALIAHIEALLDYPEEEIEEVSAQQAADGAALAAAKLQHLLDTADQGKVLREGLATVILGKPNVGKSSLLNALVRTQRAIVTDVPGTTRDVIEEYVNLRGVPLRIIDTAGIRETEDIVEKLGVERSRQMLEEADLVLVLLDTSRPLSTEDKEVLTLLGAQKSLVLLNKSDLPPLWGEEEIRTLAPGQQVLRISLAAASGLEELEEAIVQQVYCGAASQGEGLLAVNVRQEALLQQAVRHLQEVGVAAAAGMPLDCLSIDLRAAWTLLGEITGDTVGEDMITEIFSRFCIGK